jgi:hypothetical protein
MGRFLLGCICLLLTIKAYALQPITPQFKKGQCFFYWGYNRGYYSASDIYFKGNDYEFTLKQVKANDRQSKLAADPYLRIDQITIPQYDYRLGFCLTDKYALSFGFDHMKYVMNQNQTVKMSGYIHDTSSIYQGEFNDQSVVLSGNFLEFEHTDGLNYLNAEITRTDGLLAFNKHFQLNMVSGLGAGFMYPRTRCVLMNKNLNDQWHVSGYGISCNLGVNLSLGKHFYLQSAAKLGWINMPNIVVSDFKADRASQHFSFLQTQILLGYRFRL